MSDLAAWLLERISEDESGARRGMADPRASQTVLGYCSHEDAPGDEEDGPVRFYGYARVLAECAAKREIVQRCQMLIDSFERTVDGSNEYIAWPDVNRREKSHAWRNLYALALPYADHPDYRQEWRP